jgi:hypothetical protein
MRKTDNIALATLAAAGVCALVTRFIADLEAQYAAIIFAPILVTMAVTSRYPALIALAIASAVSVATLAAIGHFGIDAALPAAVAGAITVTVFSAVTAGVDDIEGGWLSALCCGAQGLAFMFVLVLPSSGATLAWLAGMLLIRIMPYLMLVALLPHLFLPPHEPSIRYKN